MLFSVSTFSQEQCQGDISVDNQKNEVEFREQNGFGTSNIPFDNMEQFSNTGTTNHWHQLTNLQNGNYVYYVKCSDAAGNVNSDDYTISFTVSQQPGNYRRLVIINNRQNPSVLSDYQIPITIDTNSLILAGKMRSDCGDIRFTDSDGSTQLSYWLESGCNTASTKIWVKVPSIPANSAKIIYLYYGDPSAPSASNGDNTFIFFDDFSTKDTTKWDWPNNWNVEGGYAKQTFSTDWSSANTHVLSSLSISSSVGIAIETNVKNGGTASLYDLQIGVGSGNTMYATNWALGAFDYLFGTPQEQENWNEADTRNFNPVTLIVMDGKQEIYINNVLEKEKTVPISSISRIYIQSKGQSEWDWIRVRKYASPEPTIVIRGEGEEAIEIQAPRTIITTVGKQTMLQLSIRNNGVSTDFYTIDLSPASSNSIEISNRRITTDSVEVGKSISVFSNIRTLTEDDNTLTITIVNSDNTQGKTIVIPVKSKKYSLPEFGFLGFLQIIAMAVVVYFLVSKNFDKINV
ncbi:MAG: DUF2341 domain-containing protein [Candidatus Aenigmatarchaeota archaeon]